MIFSQYDEKKLKIGMMIRDIDQLGHWELRIVKYIIDHPQLELALFIKDGREHPADSVWKKIKRNLFTPIKALTNILFALQLRIESVLYKPEKTLCTQEIREKTKNIETIYLKPTRKGFSDIFSVEDANTVKGYNLDVLLRHEFGIVKGGGGYRCDSDIFAAARFGIWSFHHADNALNRGLPPGFWELYHNEPCCGVTLQQLTSELDGGRIIDKAWVNWDWPFSKTQHELFEKSVILLTKSIERLLQTGNLETKKSLTYYNVLYKQPNLLCLLKYMGMYYSNIITKIPQKLFPIKRRDCWNLFIGQGSFLEATLFRIQPVAMPNNEFWADPFLFQKGDQLFTFFENYSYDTKRGKISVGKVVDQGKGRYAVTDVQDALKLDYHLSYPQIFEDEGELFLMPEAGENKRLEIYRCTQFPTQWELFATAFEGENIIDATYFRDEVGTRWLFVNKGIAYEAELYIYQIDSLKLNTIMPHHLNPVRLDCRKARSGGAVFKYENEWYRPSQINTHGKYGVGLQISKIKKLSLDEFEDEPVISVYPNFRKGLVGLHHVHQIEGHFVFDACFKKM